jgi:hypothetical protein
MSDADRLTPADPKDVALALASALGISGRKPVLAPEKSWRIFVAERLVKHLEESNFVIDQTFSASSDVVDNAFDCTAVSPCDWVEVRAANCVVEKLSKVAAANHNWLKSAAIKLVLRVPPCRSDRSRRPRSTLWPPAKSRASAACSSAC